MYQSICGDNRASIIAREHCAVVTGTYFKHRFLPMCGGNLDYGAVMLIQHGHKQLQNTGLP